MLLGLALLAGRFSGSPARLQARWYAVVFVCFVASHLLGHVIGAWPAVAAVTVAATAAYGRLLIRKPALSPG